MRILSEHDGHGEYSNRSALVVIDSNGDYGVKYVIDDTVIDYRIFPEH